MFAYLDTIARIIGYTTLLFIVSWLIYRPISKKLNGDLDRLGVKSKDRSSEKELDAFERQMNWRRYRRDEIEKLERRLKYLQENEYFPSSSTKERLI